MDSDIVRMFLEITIIEREIKDNFYRMKPFIIHSEVLGNMIRPLLSTYHYGGAADDNRASVSSVVSYACGRHIAYHHGC